MDPCRLHHLNLSVYTWKNFKHDLLDPSVWSIIFKKEYVFQKKNTEFLYGSSSSLQLNPSVYTWNGFKHDVLDPSVCRIILRKEYVCQHHKHPKCLSTFCTCSSTVFFCIACQILSKFCQHVTSKIFRDVRQAAWVTQETCVATSGVSDPSCRVGSMWNREKLGEDQSRTVWLFSIFFS
jgi:hypothetical protein